MEANPDPTNDFRKVEHAASSETNREMSSCQVECPLVLKGPISASFLLRLLPPQGITSNLSLGYPKMLTSSFLQRESYL